MQSTRDVFDQRCDEINSFLGALSDLYALNDQPECSYSYTDDNFLKILKANSILMIYNLVEASISSGINEIYDLVHSQGLTYSNVRKEIQEIWFTFKFNQVYDPNAHYNTYKAKAYEIVNSIIMNNTIELNQKAMGINGNLDANQIRLICKRNGIHYSVDPACKGGEALDDVKRKRNDLAHGTVSFLECGRSYSLNDINIINVETTVFLDCILQGMQDYYAQQSFLAVKP